MKSTYQIPSIHLDSRPLPTVVPKIIQLSEAERYRDLSNDYDLTDYPDCKRKVSALDLLRINDEKAILSALLPFPGNMTLVVVLDYLAGCRPADSLFVRRTLQAIQLVLSLFPQVTIMLAVTPTEQDFFRDIINTAYKRA